MNKTYFLTALFSKVIQKGRKQGAKRLMENIYLAFILSTVIGYIGYRAIEVCMIRFGPESQSVLHHLQNGLPFYSCVR
jgi:Na+-driven multidrug efflux pump